MIQTTHTKDAIEKLMNEHEARIAVLDATIDQREKDLQPLKAERTTRQVIVDALRGDRSRLFP